MPPKKNIPYKKRRGMVHAHMKRMIKYMTGRFRKYQDVPRDKKK